MKNTIQVAIVDDHPLYRDGVASALSERENFSVTGSGASADDAVWLVREHKPDLILLDINMPGCGLRAAQRIAMLDCGTKCVLLTVSEDQAHVKSAMEAGASGYIVKGISGSELASALVAIYGGARYVSPALAARIIARQASAPSPAATGVRAGLTSRESEITDYVARGLTNKEVARALSLSEKTIKHHMTRIMHKLHVRNRMEVVLVASGRHSPANEPAATDKGPSRSS